jgi:RNA polymerase sigma-70 factor (ECF subfamily)
VGLAVEWSDDKAEILLKGISALPEVTLIEGMRMADSPTTRPSLLVRLRDARDADAWQQFVELYGPIVYRFARRHRLQDADAADLTQEVLRAVTTGMVRFDYDPQHGSFRGWLFTLAHHRLIDLLNRRRRQEQDSGDSATHRLLDEQPAHESEDVWNQEHERQVFAWAAEQVRGQFTETTWRAFWQTAVDGRDAAAVAEELNLSVGAVYIAKSRVQARLREQIRQATDEDAEG